MCDVEKMKRQKFTQDEDDLIRELIKQYGEKNWPSIAQHLAGRTSRQIRDRWKNYLCPTIKTEPWTADDDTILYNCVIQFGKKWAQIAKMMPGRTDVSLKNRWQQMRRFWNRKAPMIDTDLSTMRFQSPYMKPVQNITMNPMPLPETMGKMDLASFIYTVNHKKINVQRIEEAKQYESECVTESMDQITQNIREMNQMCVETSQMSIEQPKPFEFVRLTFASLNVNLTESDEEAHHSDQSDELLHFDDSSRNFDSTILKWPTLENV